MADEPTESPDSQGGSGGGYVLPGKGLKNDRLERRAIMRRWNVREDALTPMVNRQINVAVDPEVPAREATQAFLAVLKAREQDLKIEELESGRSSAQAPVQLNIAVVIQQARELPVHAIDAIAVALDSCADGAAGASGGGLGAQGGAGVIDVHANGVADH